jgi:hypothetical protein
LDGINPQLKSKVFALRIAQLPAQFLLISIFKNFQFKRDGSRKMQHIVSVTLDVAFQLRPERPFSRRRLDELK